MTLKTLRSAIPISHSYWLSRAIYCSYTWFTNSSSTTSVQSSLSLFTSSCTYHLITVPIFALTVYHPSSRLDLNLICFTNPLLHSKFLATFWSALTDLGLGSDLHLLATCVFGANRKRIMQLPIVTLDISYLFRDIDV